MVVANNKFNTTKNACKSMTISKTMWNPAVRCRAHRPMKHNQPGLPLKPMDAAIGQVLALHCSGGRHGRRFWSKTQNTTKKLFLAS